MNGRALLLLIIAVVVDGVGAQHTTKCNKTMDLIFVVDGSNSVTYSSFKLVRDALKETLSELTISPKDIHAGLVTFGSQLTDRLELSGDKNYLLNGVSRLVWPDSSTNTEAGLNWAIGQMDKHGRKSVPSVIVVITDGESDSFNGTVAAANVAKDKGFQLYAIAVGPRTSNRELNSIVAPHQDSVYHLDNFQQFSQELNSITTEVCKKVCKQGVDMIFVLDGSNSVNTFNFQRMLQEVEDVSSSIWKSYHHSRVGVILYSSGISDVIALTDTSGSDIFRTTLRGLRYPNGGTTTAAAIDLATQRLVKNRREGVPPVMAVITDGRSDNNADTMASARYAHGESISVIAIGVGQSVDHQELSHIASRPALKGMASDFSKLSNTLVQELTSLCECPKPVDLIFILDGSNDMLPHFSTLKTACQTASRHFHLKSVGTRIGFITYSSQANQIVPPSWDRAVIDNGLSSLQFYGGPRRTSSGLAPVVYQLVDVRLTVPRVLVVVTCGDSPDRNSTRSIVRLLDQAATTVYAVAVGDFVSNDEMNTLTRNKTELQFYARDFDSLHHVMTRLTSDICSRDLPTILTKVSDCP